MISVLTPGEAVRRVAKKFGVAQETIRCAASLELMYIVRSARGSPTAYRLLNSLLDLDDAVSVAFISHAPEQIGSHYDPADRLVVVRTDRRYRLTEYGGQVFLDARVQLFHELGHAVQHLVLGTLGASEAPARRSVVPAETGQSQALEPGAESSPQDHWVLPFHFDDTTESENLHLHEYPISWELGQPVRSRCTAIAEAR